MKGKVLHFDHQTNEGIIVTESGERYNFTKDDVKSSVFISHGMEADFIAEENSAKEIYLMESIASFYNLADVPFYENQEKGFIELFSAQGCYTRQQFWIVTLFIMVFWTVLFTLIWFGGGYTKGHLANTNFTSIVTFFILVLIPIAYINIVTSIKRFHDTNKSGWFYLLSFIPYVGWIIVLVMNGFMPTVKEGNIYCRRKKDEV